jgi:hypothetical protein
MSQRPHSAILPGFLLAALVVGAEVTAGLSGDDPNVELFRWERGIGVASREDASVQMYLWFYEWNMFGAIKPGQHTLGSHSLPLAIDETGGSATIHSPELTLEMTAAVDGVDLLLTVRNLSDRDWPAIAGIIPCFNPGFNPAAPRPADRSTAFLNTDTFFLAAGGLERLEHREIHFNHTLRDEVDARALSRPLVFSSKWPLSESDATGGLLIRESTDRRWVTAIVWEDFLSAQGHNPWDCMHLGVRVGPLAAGGSKRIRGRIYLLPGDRDEILERVRRDFSWAV